MRFIKPLAMAGILAIGAIGFIACDDDEPSTDDAGASVCTSMDELKVAYQAVGGITAESTVEEVEDVRTDINDAWEDVDAAAADLAEARIDDLEAAYDDLAETIEGVDDDDTLAAAVTDIGTQVAAVDAAWEEFYSAAGCS